MGSQNVASGDNGSAGSDRGRGGGGSRTGVAADIAALSGQFIDGLWREGASEKELVDLRPYDGSVLTTFRVADAGDVDAAYRAADRARARWALAGPYERRAVLERAAELVRENSEPITELILDELGGTRLKAAFEIGLVVDVLKEAATFPLRMDGRILPSTLPDTENRVYRRPAGVVGVISPFNFPLFLSAKAVAPALGAGNGVVLKPHEDTPVTGGTLLGRIFEAAGLPPGLLNVVVTEIPAIGDAFLEHPVPAVLSFTGSSEVGRHVAEVAGRHLKRPVLELGGNSALLVLADADLELAVDAAVFSRFAHQGQICMSANRVLVQRARYEEFLDRFTARVAELPVGDPRDPATLIGPLINRRQAQRLSRQVDRGLAEGARAVLRGPVSGTLFAPVVLADVTPAMSVARQELFGPVVCVMPFDTEDEAVAMANDTPFGLSGAVHTRDLHRGAELAKRLETGMVHINDGTIDDQPLVAFGGDKGSGYGRLGGDWSLDAFTSHQWISVNQGRPRFPY